MAKTPTALLTEKILNFLFSEGVFCWRNSVGGTSAEYTNKAGDTKRRYMQFGKVGSGDIQGRMPPNGRGLDVELKILPDHQSPEQIGYQKNCVRVGAIYLLAQGKTWEEAYQNFLHQWKQTNP